MTLEGKQITVCDGCHFCAELKPAGDYLLCEDCAPTLCPRCGQIGAEFVPDYNHYACLECGDTYIGA